MSDNPTPTQFRQHFAALIARHRTWLKQSGEAWRLKRWNDLLDTQTETALCEAHLREFLCKRVDKVEPAEDRAAGGPDFLCTKGERRFYVEGTCLTVGSICRITGLTFHAYTACSYRRLTSLFFGACVDKAKQCSKRKDGPCLLAITTLHHAASDLCFGDVEVECALTSDLRITRRIDTRTGEPVGDSYETSDLRLSAFLTPGRVRSGLIKSARRSISGLLLCGFGSKPPIVRGVLNSKAVRPFDRHLLPTIRFCQLEKGYDNGVLNVKWIP